MANNINGNAKESSTIQLNAFDNRAFKADEFENPKAINSNGVPSVDNKNEMHFDDLLPYIGEFGRYQKMLFLLMLPFTFFLAFVYSTQIFITLVPEQHWCRIPELENLTVAERYVWKKKNCDFYAIYRPLSRNLFSPSNHVNRLASLQKTMCIVYIKRCRLRMMIIIKVETTDTDQRKLFTFKHFVYNFQM